jgi:hypothetical protein
VLLCNAVIAIASSPDWCAGCPCAAEQDREYVFDEMPETEDLDSKRAKLLMLTGITSKLRHHLIAISGQLHGFHAQAMAFFDSECALIGGRRKHVSILTKSENVFQRIGLSSDVIAHLAIANSHKEALLRDTITGIAEQRELVAKIHAYLRRELSACAP